jgi:signal transduction histidine kinase
VPVVADRRKIARVVENLLSNAIKYSPGDQKNIWVDIAVRDGVASVVVTDEGLGMTTEELYKVLTEGGRVADHAQFGIEGTGLGLGSVRQILLAHGGELHARSEKGVGSTFTAQFPVQ